MLQEFLKALSEQAVQAADPKIFCPDAEPESVYFLRGADGNWNRMKAAPFTRDHKAADLNAIIQFATANKGASVFYARNLVSCLLDDNDRRDTINLTLAFSPQLEALRGIRGSMSGVSQADLIHLLRTTFKRSMPTCPFLLDSIRKLKFDAGGTTTSEVRSNRQSLSRAQQAQVTGEAELVEEFDLVVPIFDGCLPSIQGTITIALDTDAVKQTFRLTPIPGDIEAAIRNAEDQIGVLLRKGLADTSAAERIYYGEA